MPKPWTPTGKRRVFETRLFGIDQLDLQSPAGRTHPFYLLETADWCNVVPITADGRVVMVRQHRYGIGEETLELPGGMIDPGDPNPLEAARRELEEETGYRASELIATGVIAPNPALQTNRTYSFLARDVIPAGAPKLDAGEDIEVVLVPFAEIPARVASGEICHALVVVAFAYALGLQPPK